MATEAPFLAHTQCTASVNMSSTAGLAGPNGTGQFLAVIMSGSRTVSPAGASAQIAGILQNDPAVGQAANIAFSGVTKAVAGAAITAGASLQTDASGRVITATVGTNPAIGYAIESASGANAIVTICLSNPGIF